MQVLLFSLHRHLADPAADRILKEAFGATVPSVTELAKKTSMIFVNQHYSLSGVKPLSPAVVELGGIHIKEAKPIDEVSYKYTYSYSLPSNLIYIINNSQMANNT